MDAAVCSNGRRADATCADGGECTRISAWNDVVAAIMEVWRHIGNPTPLIDPYIHLRNNPAKFHLDPIWNDGALNFEEGRLHKKNNKKKKDNNKMSSVMRSVADPENVLKKTQRERRTAYHLNERGDHISRQREHVEEEKARNRTEIFL